jgi:hypothetical protein
MQKFSLFVVLALFLFCSLPAGAQVEVNGQSYTMVKDLREELLVYSNSYDTYVPYVKGTPFRSSAAVFMLPLDHYSDFQLLIQPSPETALLINQRIVDYYWHEGNYLYPIDSLLRQHGDTAVFSLFHSGLDPEELTVAVISRQPYSSTEASAETEEFLRVYERPEKNFDNFFIVGVLVLLAVLAVLRNLFPRVFASYYDLSRALAIRVRDEPNFTMKISGRGHIPFIVFYSLLFGFLLMVLLQQAEEVVSIFDFLTFESFGSYLYAWVLLSVVVFFFQLFKYWLLMLVARIFNIGDFANIHFFDFLRLSQTFYTFMFALVVLIFLGASAYIDEGAIMLLRVVAVFAIIRVLLIFFKLLRVSQFRKTYLFSYLCTTEILPLLIGLKFLII